MYSTNHEKKFFYTYTRLTDGRVDNFVAIKTHPKFTVVFTAKIYSYIYCYTNLSSELLLLNRHTHKTTSDKKNINQNITLTTIASMLNIFSKVSGLSINIFLKSS